MQNAAEKLNATAVMGNFEGVYKDKNLDFLKFFLVSGATDISKNYELLAKREKDTTGKEKEAFIRAKKTLDAILLKRIEMTNLLFVELAGGSPVIDVAGEITAGEEHVDLPLLETVLSSLAFMTKDNKPDYDQMTAELKKTVGAGQVLGADGKPITWDDAKIAAYVKTLKPEDKKGDQKNKKGNQKGPEIKKGEKLSWEKIYAYALELVATGKNAEEVKTTLKYWSNNQTVIQDNVEVLLKGDADKAYETYYDKILKTVVEHGITERDKTKATKAKPEEILEKEVKPLLLLQDKDEKVKSLIDPTKVLKDKLEKAGIKKGLRDCLLDVIELGNKIAPNLMARYRKNNGNKPILNEKGIKKNNPAPEPELYDDSHNLAETNPNLLAEANNFTKLSQVFDKSVEVVKTGDWKDALCMCITILANGKIMETDKSTEGMKWTADQAKDWFNTVIIPATKLEEKKDAVVTDAEIVKETKEKVEGATNPITPAADKQLKKESQENTAAGRTGGKAGSDSVVNVTEDKGTSIQQGPVPKSGTIDKTNKSIKDTTIYKDKYPTKTVSVNSTNKEGKIDFEVVDAPADKEKDLFVTEANLVKFIDSQRDVLVGNANKYGEVRGAIHKALSLHYEMTNSDTKGIMESLAKEATKIRQTAKKQKMNQPGEQKQNSGQTTPEVDATAGEIKPASGTSEKKKPSTEVKTEVFANGVDNDDISGDDEGSLYYNDEDLKPGFALYEKKGDKKVPIADGAYTVPIGDEGAEIGITTKDGKIATVEPLDAQEETEGKEDESKNSSDVASDKGTPGAQNATASPDAASSTAEKTDKAPLPDASAASKDSQPEKKGEGSKETTGATEKVAGGKATNSNKNGEDPAKEHLYEDFKELLEPQKKLEFHKAISEKVASYPTEDEGIKAVYEAFDYLRLHSRSKRAHINNFKATQPVDILSCIKTAVENGKKAKAQTA